MFFSNRYFRCFSDFMEITIRNSIESDFPQIAELFKEFAAFEKQPEKMTNSVGLMVREKEYFNCFVAENEKKEIVGYAAYFFSYYTWIGKSLYMDDLYVKEKYRKKGVGKKLLESVINLAKKENCHKVRWQVSNWNKNGQEFYKKIGAEIGDTELNCDLFLRK